MELDKCLCECYMHHLLKKCLCDCYMHCMKDILSWINVYVNVTCIHIVCEIETSNDKLGKCLCKCYIHILFVKLKHRIRIWINVYVNVTCIFCSEIETKANNFR